MIKDVDYCLECDVDAVNVVVPTSDLHLKYKLRKSRDEMIKDAFDLLSDRICAIHAKDFIVEDGRLKGTKITEGMLNYNLIFEKMREYNVDVPIICEGMNEEDSCIAYEKLECIRKNYE